MSSVSPERYAEYVEKLGCGALPIPRVTKSKDANALNDGEMLERCREIASVFATVERLLQADNLGTFGHMITKASRVAAGRSRSPAQEQQRARFILVDEFQDANFAQVKILSALAGTERNVFAVGDPDQAIYRFRGASSAAFGLFERNFPGARLVVLEKNQRSLTPILQCAFALIDRNPLRRLRRRSRRQSRLPTYSATFRTRGARRRGRQAAFRWAGGDRPPERP